MQRRYGYDWADQLFETIGACLLIGVVGIVYLALIAYGLFSLVDAPPTTVIIALLVGILIHQMCKK